MSELDDDEPFVQVNEIVGLFCANEIEIHDVFCVMEIDALEKVECDAHRRELEKKWLGRDLPATQEIHDEMEEEWKHEEAYEKT